ncbi:11938_t:CDS:2, partial [Acaulospora colombiana]
SVNKAPRELVKSKYAIDPLDQFYGSSLRDFSQPKIEQLPMRSVAAATPVIQAEPQVRNLQKELTTLVPSSLLRKKASASKPKVARPVVNAAPNIDDGVGASTPTAVKRSASTAISLLQQSEYDTQTSEQQPTSTGPPQKKSRTKKKTNNTSKFPVEIIDAKIPMIIILKLTNPDLPTAKDLVEGETLEVAEEVEVVEVEE